MAVVYYDFRILSHGGLIYTAWPAHQNPENHLKSLQLGESIHPMCRIRHAHSHALMHSGLRHACDRSGGKRLKRPRETTLGDPEDVKRVQYNEDFSVVEDIKIISVFNFDKPFELNNVCIVPYPMRFILMGERHYAHTKKSEYVSSFCFVDKCIELANKNKKKVNMFLEGRIKTVVERLNLNKNIRNNNPNTLRRLKISVFNRLDTQFRNSREGELLETPTFNSI